MSALPGEDPAVSTWRIAMAPRPRYSPGTGHWWRELVTDAWRCAYDQWVKDAEAASNGWATELAEFKAEHPVPQLRDFLRGLSSGSMAPERTLGAA